MEIFAKISKYLHDRCEKSRQETIEWCQRHNAAIDEIENTIKRLQKYDSYVQFENTLNDDTMKYEFSVNARNEAESLIYARLRAKYGDIPLHIHTKQIHWPYDTTLGNVMDIMYKRTPAIRQFYRIYYKAHPNDETCELCKENK